MLTEGKKVINVPQVSNRTLYTNCSLHEVDDNLYAMVICILYTHFRQDNNIYHCWALHSKQALGGIGKSY